MYNRISKISDNLYLGTWKAAVYATNPDKLGSEEKMDVIISALTEDEYDQYDLRSEDFEDVEWHRLIVDDDLYETIKDYFVSVHEIISKAIEQGKNVLVHCAQGVSRSPTLVAAHLMLENRINAEDALGYIRHKRLIIEPNMGFEHQLDELDTIIKSTTSELCENE